MKINWILLFVSLVCLGTETVWSPVLPQQEIKVSFPFKEPPMPVYLPCQSFFEQEPNMPNFHVFWDCLAQNPEVSLPIPSFPPVKATGYFRIASGYGQRYHPLGFHPKKHQGLDFAVPTGTPVFATAKGTVTVSDYSKGYGKYIVIQHAFGYATRYAHLSQQLAEKGETVKSGEIVGWSGATGKVTGPHLHYEVHKDDIPVNPAPFCATQWEVANRRKNVTPYSD